MTRKNTRKKEEIAEDYCFFCKDGGLLRVCDHNNCLKSFHPRCAGRDDSLLETEDRWLCGWHFCFLCNKQAKFHCFCCPIAVCGRCLCDTEFAVIKGARGLCNMCLELALLIEDKKNVNSKGEKVDFNDGATYEYLFKYYWEVVKEKEGLTSQQLHSTDRLLKKGKNYDIQASYNCKEDIRDFEDDSISESDDWRDNQVQCRKKKRGKLSSTKRKGKPKKKEYLGWASKQLAEFLMFIGKDATQELSQYDVATIIIEYCNGHKLFHPEKKKKVICDEMLQSLLGRKSVNKNGIYKLLTVHFSENLEKSEDSVGFSLEEDDNASVPCKRQQKSSPDRKFEEKEIATNLHQGYLAAIVSRNIKLVYLKRSLVLELAKELDTFNDKMVGSFVRVKSDTNDYFQKNSHILVQVKGIKETSIKEETNSTILLQVSNRLRDVRICELSDNDFTEEEIKDLNRRMGTRMLERPTVLQLQQKARSLHEDITKHWIKNELVLLQSQINRANEKGWRREYPLLQFHEFIVPKYIENYRQLITISIEQSRLLHEVPEVVAEAAEPEPVSKVSLREYREEHKALSESAPGSVSRIGKCILEKNVVSSCRNDRMDAAEGNQQNVEKSFISTRVEGDEMPRNPNSQDVKQSCNGTSVLQLLPEEESADRQTRCVCTEKQHKCGDAAGAGETLVMPVVYISEHLKVENYQAEVIELSDDERQEARLLKQRKHGDAASDVGVHVKVENHQVEVIDLSDDEIDNAAIAASHQASADHDCSIWYCISPHGTTKGPYSMKVLKQWSASSTSRCELHFKVYKRGQRPEDALLLIDAFRQ
ncbi:hypothetical protein HRI_004493400 [Hibiscus trionum]|uniref:Uncharacterized protein n=1 Tax=Hibiscus trionum TaxID=183268 RepID=A0A9W7J562_HIBTR|nr:hypothetical protein HRI_004493400 [Hibiscus trionum]